MPTDREFFGALKPRSAERRQVTALSYDLVGSTRLSMALDAEDFAALLREFHERCVDAVRRYGGHVDNIAGDGGMVFFGLPTAHEDDAERAVLAGIEILAKCASQDNPFLPKDQPVSVRVGVATGLVVAGAHTAMEPRQQGDVLGPAPYVAFRLQAAADPNTVLVSAATRELVGELFEFAEHRDVEIGKGAEPHSTWRVIRELPGRIRLQAIRMRSATPLVARTRELAILEDRWKRTLEGKGQAVVIRGEPGIGKSRLAATFKDRVLVDDSLALDFQCSSQHANTALYPLSSWLDRQLERVPHDWPAERRDRFELMLKKVSDNADRFFPIVARLLSVAAEGWYPSLELEAEAIKERGFKFLLDAVPRLAERRAIFLLVEDLQWIDPTSMELLDQLARSALGMRLMLVATARPDVAVPWVGQANLTVLDLERLESAKGAEIVRLVAGGQALPDKAIGKILERADGIPLYLEELTRATLAGSLLSTSASAAIATDAPLLQIPATLADSLTSRLDHLGSAKEILQIGAAIGRTFSVSIACGVAGIDEYLAIPLVRQISELGLGVLTGEGAAAVCTFKHALIQEAAYQSMLRGKRADIHRQIADRLQRDFAGEREAAPEILAHHYEKAGLPKDAISALRQAADIAASRSANIEAKHLLREALRLLGDLPSGEERDRLEMTLLITLGPLCITTSGPGTPEVQSVYLRAIELCKTTPLQTEHFATYWGWWRIASNAEELRERADLLSGLAAQLNNAQLSLQAHHCQWATLFGLGELVACRAHVTRGIELYDEVAHGYGALYGGHDPKVCALHELALCLWLTGFPDQSLGYCQQGIAHARTLRHVGSTAQSLDQEIILYRFRGEAAKVQERAAAMMAFAEEHGIKDLSAKALIFRGWASSAINDARYSLNDIETGLSIQRAIGTNEEFPLFLEMAASCQARAGNLNIARSLIEEAITLADRSGAQYWLPEVFRQMAEIQLLERPGNVAVARDWLDKGADMARRQKSNSLLLRCEIDAAKLLARDGAGAQARERLNQVYGEFSEGFDTPDLIAARGLISTLEDASGNQTPILRPAGAGARADVGPN